METLVIWDAILLIMTWLSYMSYNHIDIYAAIDDRYETQQ